MQNQCLFLIKSNALFIPGRFKMPSHIYKNVRYRPIRYEACPFELFDKFCWYVFIILLFEFNIDHQIRGCGNITEYTAAAGNSTQKNIKKVKIILFSNEYLITSSSN